MTQSRKERFLDFEISPGEWELVKEWLTLLDDCALAVILGEVRRRERTIFIARYLLGWSLDEIAARYQLTRERVRQIGEKVARRARYSGWDERWKRRDPRYHWMPAAAWWDGNTDRWPWLQYGGINDFLQLPIEKERRYWKPGEIEARRAALVEGYPSLAAARAQNGGLKMPPEKREEELALRMPVTRVLRLLETFDIHCSSLASLRNKLRPLFAAEIEKDTPL